MIKLSLRQYSYKLPPKTTQLEINLLIILSLCISLKKGESVLTLDFLKHQQNTKYQRGNSFREFSKIQFYYSTEIDKMNNRQAILQLYRSFFLFTRNCQDRSLQLYIRRRATEDFRAASRLGENESQRQYLRLKQEAEIVRRQMTLRNLYSV